MSSPQFIIARPGTKGIISSQEYTEMFVFLHQEWLDADKLLEEDGFPAHVEEFGQIETSSLAQRMRLWRTQGVEDAQQI